MAYTGTWKRRFVRTDDPDRVLWDTGAALAHTAGNDENVPGKLDRQDPTSPPSMAGGGSLATTSHDGYSLPDVPGGPLDATPRGHRGDGVHVDRGSDHTSVLRGLAASGGRHSAGFGATRARNTDVPKGRQRDYRHYSMEWPAPGVSAYSSLANVRGLNARPENNPDGHPRTTVGQFLRATRRMVGHNFFSYSERPQLVNIADAPSHSPALDAGSQYVSPYATVQSAKGTRAMTNTMRRAPAPWDEDMVTDGYTTAEPFQSWGL